MNPTDDICELTAAVVAVLALLWTVGTLWLIWELHKVEMMIKGSSPGTTTLTLPSATRRWGVSDAEKRDAVLAEFAYDAAVHRVWGVAGMADEILRLRAERAAHILSALREPSEAVVESACLALYGAHNWSYNDPGDAEWRADARQRFITQLSAAVAAAEQEVGCE